MFQFQYFKFTILLFISGICLLIPFFFFLPQVHATPLYTVTPLVIDETLQARDIVTKQITITNTGGQQVTVYPSVNNISIKEGERIDEFLPPVMSDRSTSLASWVEISRRGISLQPGDSHTLDLTLRINLTASPGTYHAYIGFGYGRTRDDAEKQVLEGRTPGVVVSVTIEEKKNVIMKLSKFIVDRFVTSADNQAAVYTFTNSGDEVVAPKGEIIFYDSTGAEISTTQVNEENVTILPGDSHTFSASVPTDGMFGKYKAFLSVEYGTENRASVQDTSYFYVLPLKAILIIFGICAIIVIFTALYVHKRYIDPDIDDSEHITLNVKDSKSEAKDHDIVLIKKNDS